MVGYNRQWLVITVNGRLQSLMVGYILRHQHSDLLAFTRLGGKILYRSSDTEKLLDSCYREAFHWMNDFNLFIKYSYTEYFPYNKL